MRERSGRVTQRCHNRPDGKRGSRVRVTSRIGSARRIWGILKKVSWVENWTPNVKGRLSLPRGGALRAPLMLVVMVVVGKWKNQNRKIVYLSPYVEEPLNSKVIKSFVPELRSRKCFSCFEIPMIYVYMLWTFYVHFTHIRISGYVTFTDIFISGCQVPISLSMKIHRRCQLPTLQTNLKNKDKFISNLYKS